MERLNEIMARAAQQAQRRRVDQQPLQQGQRPGQMPSGDAPQRRFRRPLREQMAHLGKTTPPATSSPTQLTSRRTPSVQGEPPVQRPVPAQQMPPVPDIRPPVYQQRPQPLQEVQRPPRSDYYQTDAYTVQADVADEWDEDEEGMRYGDWESDGHAIQNYGRPSSELVPRVNRPSRDLPSTSAMRPYVGPTPRGRSTPPALPVPPPAPQVSVQEVQQHFQHRMTQPLKPRSPLHVNQDTPPYHTARPTRQLVPPEQMVQSIPAPYTIPTEVCPICKGAGYLRADVPYGHPNFGKPIACECKETERAEKRRLQLYSISNMDAFRNQNFKNFHPNVSRSVQRAYQIAYEYARDPSGWLVMIGPNGCGKTHLAAAIANQSLEDGSVVLFMTVADLLDHLRATFVPSATEVYDQLFAKMCEAGVLILDDLGAQQSSPWANEKLFQLLNYRYNSHFPTIITTNNIGLQGIEERIRSRMMDTGLVTTVTFEGSQDYRLRNPRRS
jgi:DNA replication protein DnaC